VHAEVAEAADHDLLDVQSQRVEIAHRGQQQPGLCRVVDLHPGLATVGRSRYRRCRGCAVAAAPKRSRTPVAERQRRTCEWGGAPAGGRRRRSAVLGRTERVLVQSSSRYLTILP
jgi:hypothetical protein